MKEGKKRETDEGTNVYSYSSVSDNRSNLVSQTFHILTIKSVVKSIIIFGGIKSRYSIIDCVSITACHVMFFFLHITF